jgi:hypothetical protein
MRGKIQFVELEIHLRNVRIRLGNWRRSIYEHGVFVMMQVFKLSFLGLLYKSSREKKKKKG